MAINTKYQNLFEFCVQGDRIGLADYIITNSCNPSAYDARDTNGQTAVHIACQHGHLFTVRSLVEVFGCSPTIVDNSGNLPLHVACLHGHLPTVAYLFSLVANEKIATAVFQTDLEGNNLLHKACQSGSVATVRYILQVVSYPKKELISKKLNLYQDSVSVYDAASSEKPSFFQVKSLLQCITRQNTLGDTALHVACRHGHLNVLKVFQVYFPYNDLLKSLFLISIKCNHADIVNFLTAVKNETVLDFNSEAPGFSNLKKVVSRQKFQIIDQGATSRTLLGTFRQNFAICEDCRGHFNISIIPQFNKFTSTGHCPACQDRELRFHFRCKSCSSSIYSDELKLTCSACKSPKLVLLAPPIDPFLSHHIATYCLQHAQEPSQAAALSGNLVLYRQAQMTFSSTDKTLLHAACISDNVELVKHIMETLNVGINELDSEDNTPLHVACEWGSCKVFSFFLSFRDIQLSKTNKFDQSPLSLACKHSRNEFVIKLLEYEIKNDKNALHIVCGNGKVGMVKKILKHGGNTTLINDVDKHGDTPIFDACRSGNLELIKFLVTKGSNPLFVNEKTKETPIHIACRMNRPDILEALCQSQLINDQSLESNIFGISPIHLAIENNCLKSVKMIIKFCSLNLNQIMNKKQSTLTHCAIQTNNIELINCLLQQPSVNWNAQDSDGNSALHLACIDDKEVIVKLIAKHTSITNSNKKRMTPVHIAVSKNNLTLLLILLQDFSGSLDECVSSGKNTLLHIECGKMCITSSSSAVEMTCLLSNVCSVISQNDAKQTPLHLACESKNIAILEHLLRKLPEACNLDELVDADQNTVLHVAVKNEFIAAIILLSEHTSVKCKNSSGETPIHIACELGDLQIVRILVSKTKDVVYSKSGSAYLHSACQGKSLKIVNFLLNDSQLDCPSLLAADKEGNNPLHEACLLGNTEMIKLLLPHCSNEIRNLSNHMHYTPFCCLLIKQHTDVIVDLLSEKVIDNKWCTDAQPLLHSVVMLSSSENVYDLTELMVSRNYCDPPACDKNDNTILHCFIQKVFEIRSNYSFKKDVYLKLWYYLLEIPGIEININMQNENGDTPLHMLCKIHERSGSGGNNYIKRMIERLLAHAESIIYKSLSSENKEGRTPVQLANKQVMKLLIPYGANPKDVYSEFRPILDKYKHKHPLERSVKVVLTGNSTAGKTTFVRAIKQLELKQDSTPIEDVNGPTAGIETSVLNSKHLGHVTFHDFAGQPEFESSNSAFLENPLPLDQSPIYLLLVDVSNDFDVIEKHTQYWFTFIQNHSPQQLETPPHVVILGSHSDYINTAQHNKVEKCISAAIQTIYSGKFQVIGPYLLDCRQIDTNLHKIRMMLAKSCSSLRKTVDIDIRCHILYAYLSTWFNDKPAVKFHEIQNRIKSLTTSSATTSYSEDVLLPFTKDTLLDLLKSLHVGGHILLLNTEPIDDCWVVMDNDSLFEKVNGTLFAPTSFNRHILKINTGIVSEVMLLSLFGKEIDIDLITTYSVLSEFCRKIEDSKTLKLIEGGCTEGSQTEGSQTFDDEEDQSSISDYPEKNISYNESSVVEKTTKPNYYFFPGLVKCERQADVWRTSQPTFNNFGWYLLCNKHSFFDPRFLYVLLLRLTFTFAPSTKESPQHGLVRKCYIWKNGIHWSTTLGVEVLVEVIEQNTAVLLLVRCFRDDEIEGVKLRSQIINTILEAKDQFCPKAKVTEYILAECSQYPPDLNLKIPFYDIAQSIAQADAFVVDSRHSLLKLEDLLFYDPYFKIGKNLIEKLWSEECSEEEVPLKFLFELSKAQTTHMHQISKILSVPQSDVDSLQQTWASEPAKLLLHIYEWWKDRQEKSSFENLRKVFSLHSIFCDRNPLVSSCTVAMYCIHV